MDGDGLVQVPAAMGAFTSAGDDHGAAIEAAFAGVAGEKHDEPADGTKDGAKKQAFRDATSGLATEEPAERTDDDPEEHRRFVIYDLRLMICKKSRSNTTSAKLT